MGVDVEEPTRDLAGVAPGLMAELEVETSELLAELIRIDTSNPPGNETAMAEHMAAWFGGHGLEGEIVGEPAARRSFVLRLEGARPGPTLLLLAHEDVVPACGAEWREPPFAGRIRDGAVWGRGAVDVKNLVAAHAVAVRRLAAAGAPFAGTVVYACTADEEDGRECGARWLAEHRPDLVRCDYLLNEGGGGFIRHGERRVHLLNTGEKGTAPFRLTVHGEGGHASVPLRQGNAVAAAARIVEALAAHELPPVVDESSRELVELLVDDADLRARLREPERARRALAELAARDRKVADLIEPLYGFAFSPTMVRSSSPAVNVYSTTVELSVDCRMLAGHTCDEVEAEVRAALAGVDAQWELEWMGGVPGNSSAYPSPLSAALRGVLGRLVPGAEVANAHSVGFTDSNWFRAAFPDVVAYDFAPHLVESNDEVAARYHNADERILVRDLAFQALFAERVALELLA